MEIRPYRAEDLERVLALFQDTVYTVNARDYSRRQLEAWAGRPDRSAWGRSLLAHAALVAEDGEGLLGLPTWTWMRRIWTGSMSTGATRGRGSAPPCAAGWRPLSPAGGSRSTPPSPPGPSSRAGATMWSGSSRWSAGASSSPTSSWSSSDPRGGSKGPARKQCFRAGPFV